MGFFFVFPSIYMLFRLESKLPIKKIIFVSFLFGILAGILDILVNASKGWLVPDNQLFFHIRILGYAPLEEIIWFFSFSSFYNFL